MADGSGIVVGFDTSVPVAAGVRWRERRPRAVRVGVNEQRIAAPAAGVSVKRSPERRARMETIIGVADAPTVVPVAAVVAPAGAVVAAVVVAPVAVVVPVPAIVPAPVVSPACKATAVYPPVVVATMRPVLPSAVVNWFPVIVNVVSPVSPRASQLNVPVYVPDRSVCSAARLAVDRAGVVVCAGVCAGSVCCWPGAGIASAGVVV